MRADALAGVDAFRRGCVQTRRLPRGHALGGVRVARAGGGGGGARAPPLARVALDAHDGGAPLALRVPPDLFSGRVRRPGRGGAHVRAPARGLAVVARARAHVVDGLADAGAARGYARRRGAHDARQATVREARAGGGRGRRRADVRTQKRREGGRRDDAVGDDAVAVAQEPRALRVGAAAHVVLPLNLAADGHGVAASSGAVHEARRRADDASAYKQAQARAACALHVEEMRTRRWRAACATRRGPLPGARRRRRAACADRRRRRRARAASERAPAADGGPDDRHVCDRARSSRPRARGGVLFRELLLPLAARRAGRERFYVFAQCVETGGARLFWMDRLDETPVARSLMMRYLSGVARR